jgi:DNA-binding LytR/AlgR family response regulator
VQFAIDKLIYIEGLGNYLNVYYENNGIKKMTIRETFGNLEKRLSGSEIIYKPHRSYLINLQYIEKLTGDSQGLKIHVKNFDTVIPVSRSKTNEFRQICSSQLDA